MAEMTRILLLFFLLKASLLVGQVDFTQVYHPIINDAELALIDSNYVEALDFYKEAFRNVEKPFAKDIYNAAVCAFYADKPSIMFEYLEKLAAKGLPYDTLKKDVFFKLIMDSTTKWKKFEVQYRKVKPLINRELRDSLLAMQENYQKTFRMLDPPEVTFYTDNISKKFIDSLRQKGVTVNVSSNRFNLSRKDLPPLLQTKRDSADKAIVNLQNKIVQENVQKLSKIMDNVGFPDENLVGLSLPSLNDFLAADILLQEQHKVLESVRNGGRFYKRDSSAKQAQELPLMIFQAVRDGKILPRTAQRILRNNFSNEAYQSGNVRIFKITPESNLTCKDEWLADKKDQWLWKKEEFLDYTPVQVNEIRTKIGLEPVDDCYRKLFYKQKMPFFEMNSGAFNREYAAVSSCATMRELAKNTQIVK